MKRILLIVSALLLAQLALGQRFAGIEIGGKGVKIAVIDVKDIEKGDFTIVRDWSRNTAVTKNISIDKKLAPEDITETATAVAELYEQLKTDFKLDPARIFIVGSSGVAMATNRTDLRDKVASFTGKTLEFISSEQEGKLVTKGAVPVNRYDNSMVWDIGGGNSKGGYVLKDAGYWYFYPMAFDYGSVTLTEAISKRYQPKTFEEFAAGLQQFTYDTLAPGIVKRMFDNKPAARRKTNLYAIGGASWAFATLMHPENSENYMKFSTAEVFEYQRLLKDANYEGWIAGQSKKNPAAVERILNTYSREALLVGATILAETIRQMNDFQQLNCYFVRKGYVAWTIAYIVDSLRRGSPLSGKAGAP